MKYVEVAVRLDPSAARERAGQELESRGFRVNWNGEWDAVAERGNAMASMALGAFYKQHMKFGLKVMGADQGTTVVRFEKLSSGWSGGAIGAMRVDKQLKSLRDDFAGGFQSAGLLAGVSEG